MHVWVLLLHHDAARVLHHTAARCASRDAAEQSTLRGRPRRHRHTYRPTRIPQPADRKSQWRRALTRRAYASQWHVSSGGGMARMSV